MHCRDKYPDHLFVAEEDISEGKNVEVLTEKPTWLIDPLDGTINFVSRVPFVAVSIGFAINKKIVVGVVYNPILDEMFTAVLNQGAFLNNKRIHVSDVKVLKNAVVATACGAELSEEDINTFNKRMSGVISHARTWRRFGSAAMV